MLQKSTPPPTPAAEYPLTKTTTTTTTINSLKNQLSRNATSVKTFQIHIRLDILSDLIWVQTVCKGQ